MIPLEQGSVFRPNVVAATRTSVVSLNPFGTGLCLPTLEWILIAVILPLSQSLWNRAVSSDSVMRYVLKQKVVSQSLWNRAVSSDKKEEEALLLRLSLNPFGTGLCLPTYKVRGTDCVIVSIPLEQGCVFRQANWAGIGQPTRSQSLWNRAVSSDCSGILKPCGTRLTRATFQLFPRLRELGLDLIKCCTNFNILFTYQAVENRGDFTRVFRFY